MMNYWWVRIFDYKQADEAEWIKKPLEETWFEKYKGIMLDEYYLCGEDMTRDTAKAQVVEHSKIVRFAKPRKGDDVYCILMESTQFFYDRFYKTVNTHCLYCRKPVVGKWAYFPKQTINDVEYLFCNYDCRRSFQEAVDPNLEGEWQDREDINYTGLYGYIYHIYNRKLDMHYVGQTRYMPFFRWQEHVKDKLKGDITDLVFEVITEVREPNQSALNDAEAWWINTYIDDYGREHVMNITTPHLHEQHFVDLFNQLKGVKVEEGT